MCRERTDSKFVSFMNSKEWIVKVRYNISSNGICPIWRAPGGCFSIKFTLEAIVTHLSLCQWRTDLRTATWGLLHFRDATRFLIPAFSTNSLRCLLKKIIISLKLNTVISIISKSKLILWRQHYGQITCQIPLYNFCLYKNLKYFPSKITQ